MSWINEVFSRKKKSECLGATNVSLLVPERLFKLRLGALQVGKFRAELSEIPLTALSFALDLLLSLGFVASANAASTSVHDRVA